MDKCENDSRVNQPVPDIAFDVKSNADFQELRRRWAQLERIPKLVDATTCPVISAGPTSSTQLVLKGEESAGSLMVCLVTLKPGPGAGRHYQPLEDELWFAVQGTWEWTIGDQVMRVGPGGFAYAPRNTTHAFSNVGDGPAVMFTLNTPAGHERGFQALYKLRKEEAPQAAIQDTFARYDFIFHDQTPAPAKA
jgi:quercetin dioxygenase-like cupin family protein